jgi:nicotinate-nucleotide adenylyltransferase
MSHPLVIILGGTFDPVHEGHLYIAEESYRLFKPTALWLMPCGQPVHRELKEVTAVHHRLAMLHRAARSFDYMQVVTYETDLDGPSITLDTLKRLKRQFPKTHFCYLLGQDVIEDVHHWDDWPKLRDYAHLIVVNRLMGQSKELTRSVPMAWQPYITHRIDDLSANDHGCIYCLTLPPKKVEATEIRACMFQGLTFDLSLVPSCIIDYIVAHDLYRK